MKLGRHYLQHFMVTSLENTVVENVNIEVTGDRFLDTYTQWWSYYIFSAGLKDWREGLW